MKTDSLPTVEVVKRAFERRIRPFGLQRLIDRLRARDARDAVFVWIPKAAGTSIWSLLDPSGRRKLIEPYLVRHRFGQKGLVTFGHQSYVQLVEQGIVTQEFHARAYKFCFVRNPFDRMVSLYSYLVKYKVLHSNVSFRTFVYLVRDTAFDEIGLYNLRGLSQCNSQVSWITDRNGSVFVDFIGRVEHLDRDFRHVVNELGLALGDRVPRENTTRHKPFSEYYDAELKKIVADVYRDDFEILGYDA